MDKSEDSYCIRCNEKVKYIIKSQRKNVSVRGVSFSYVEQIAYCPICGEEVYAPAVNDHNVAASKSAFDREMQSV